MNEIVSQAPLWRDYLEMCKPRVVLLMLLCALVGMYLATPGGTTTNSGAWLARHRSGGRIRRRG